MARVAPPIKNGDKLDKVIADKCAEMQAKGVSRQFKITIGGGPPGLMLQVTPAGTSSWILRTTINGARRDIGLGSYRRAGASSRERPSTSLSAAREAARDYYKAISKGDDPLALKQAVRAAKKTFREVALEYLDENESAWRNPKHRQQWRNTLESFAFPIIGDLPVASIDKVAVKSVLMKPVDGEPLWTARHETATRLRQRMERIFRHARAHGYREATNPATWSDNLDALMPKVAAEVKEVEHHAALPYTDAATFMADLHGRPGMGARALRFLIYTAARSGEVRGARWDEINLDLALWTVPKERMKRRIQHTVPLSQPAMQILLETPPEQRNGLIFPSTKRDAETGEFKMLSDMTLAAVLKRMGYADVTVHGFRSTFRDWGGEISSYHERVLENALAHQLDDKTAASYARGKQLDKRRNLMNDWAEYLAT
jgi:integrase